ncbi:putative bifunctional diguanylate cyclase/phosphodiesterase [Ectothiorhodospira variabilis]|uniref:putative bifunctional diguanylate cyclase/phosphodiesterase n=1 Tax=Ectothiorhodospira variabilis TaxID=505694 RepID=UPI001EFA5219|nr:EAL domain-containing protein [Ectothiorhodospira variabilis]MCG5498797.1 EAL domain-containing protein [Ectothiorhodospira variabilis]
MTQNEDEAQPDVDYLRERVRHLEQASQWHHYAMDVLTSMTAIFGDHSQSRDVAAILESTHECVGRLLPLEDAGYYTVDDESSFHLSFRQAGCEGPELEAIVEQLIDEGMFSWALNQNHPVCLPCPGNDDKEGARDDHLVLHVISSRTRIRGMFVGRTRGQPIHPRDPGMKVLSIVLFNAAYALESAALYTLMDHQHKTLKKISERQSLELAHQYSHDALTGLPNRVLFSDRLHQLIQKGPTGDEDDSSHVAVILMDLDHFKRVNDSLGHGYGDHLIKNLADNLRTILADTELLGHHHLDEGHVTLSRLGGDEFGIILDRVDSLDLLARFAQHLLDNVSCEYVIHDHPVFLTCSAGISIHPFDGRDVDTLIKNADAAMYEAKQRGRNHYHFYTQDINAQTYRHLMLENELSRALDRDEFQLHYQPQISLATGKVEGLEALVRWEHPEKGYLNPGHFIPVAEDTGLIEQLGLWVVRRACADMNRLETTGLPVPRMAINLSPRQFRQADLAAQYAAIISDAGIQASQIELELTESTIMQDIDKAVEIFGDMQQLGFRLAVDDFGTGYSSLNQLKHFPIHTLKIDRSFIRGIPQDRDDAAIVKAIVAMAKGLGLEVVAEGVEARHQLDFLKGLDCESVQGFYFSRPLPYDELCEYLQASESVKATTASSQG